MEKTTNKTEKGLVLNYQYTPTSPADTFMACISHWRYGTVARRDKVRRLVLLDFICARFGRRFDTFRAFVRAYLGGRLPCDTPAFEFVLRNTRAGVVYDLPLMCAAVADCFRVDVYINRQPPVKTSTPPRVGELFLKRAGRHGKFSFLLLHGLSKTRSTVMYALCVSLQDDEWVRLGEMERADRIHTLRVDAAPDKRLYTVVPVDTCHHTAAVFVFVRPVGSRECTLEGASATAKHLNPYFIAALPAPVDVIVVVAESEDGAVKLLELKNKVVVL